MIGRRAVIGLSLLCALAFSAIAASGAMAESKTTTAFTCVEKAVPGGAGFSKAHCRETADAVSTGAKFEHVAIAAGSWTVIDATNANTASETAASTNAVLTSTVGGLKATITCPEVTVTGEIENFEDPVTHAMDVKGRNIIIHYNKCVLSGALATVEGCKVENEAITTNKLTSTSLINTMESEYKPAEGEVFATIPLTGCKNPELNKGLSVTGTAKAIGDGATLETTAASTTGLKFGGQTASYTSNVTLRMTNGTTTENPISSTTIVDP